MAIRKDQTVLVDKNDKILGFKEKFATHNHPVAMHRAISVMIIDKKGEYMLLQKRSKYKKTWPLFWTNTVCTDVRPNETYKAAAVRRLKEEMDIVTPLKEVFTFTYEAKYDKNWGEHELDHAFVGKYEGVINADPMQAAGYQWMKIQDLKKDLKKNPEIYTPWFKIILRKLKV